ncbi:flagellar motor switch protein FliM [Candidatus Dependentiae bacterium]|nr:flagellar motor switch protein FliM [Candidatus Dependentiae bacterium]
MTAELLSQDEIDSLLTAISSGGPSTGGGDSGGGLSSASSSASSVSGGGGAPLPPPKVKSKSNKPRKIKLYDFKRPDKFSKDQIRTLQMIHEVFARLNTAALSALLRTMVHVHVASVDQLTYEEFLKSIPNPTTVSVIEMKPLNGSTLLEMDPAIVFALIDRLFGGKGYSANIAREMTDIELSVMENVMAKILSNLKESWINVIDLKPKLEKIESNPQFVQIVPPNDMVVLVTLETKVGEVEGMTNFCIPYIVIEPIINKLSAQYWYASVRKGSTTESLERLRQKMNYITVEAGVEVGEALITIEDVLKLETGDVIRLNRDHKSDMLLYIDNNPKFSCKPGIKNNKYSVLITDEIDFTKALQHDNWAKKTEDEKK